MADKSNVDIIMMLKDDQGAIAAESTSAIDNETGWTDDFTAGKYFEIDDFKLGIDIEDNDSPSTGQTMVGPDGKPVTLQSQQKGGKFSNWIKNIAPKTATGAAAVSSMYGPVLKPISFTRQADSASPLIIKNCFKVIPFVSAAIVMRKTGGLQGTSGIGHIGFIRIDFTSVLITGIDWDGGEVVKETCEFVCRTLQVKYRSQKSSGAGGKMSNSTKLSLVKATD
jgi:type VI protein secretion system component Hcp